MHNQKVTGKKATRKFSARECKGRFLAVLLQENKRLNCGCGLFTPLCDFHMLSTAAHAHTYIHARARARARKIYSEESNTIP
jgi:hypothetical protein